LVAAALQPAGAAQSSLYRINLTAGAATLVGMIGPAGTPLLRAFAVRVQ